MQQVWLYTGIGGDVQESTSRVEHDVSIIQAGTPSVQRMRVPGKHGRIPSKRKTQNTTI